jgi:hypothetical protein
MRCFLISSVFLLFYSGQISDSPEWMIFRVYSSDNEWLGVDTLCIPVLKSNSILKHYRKEEFLLISEKGIEEINQKKLGKSLLFSFQDTTQLSPYNINTCIPFIKSDSKLVARKLLPSDYEIYKRQIESTDLETKLHIVKSLVLDILRSYARDKHEFNLLVEEISNPLVLYDYTANLEFEVIAIKTENSGIISRLPEPIKISLNSLSVIVEKIHVILLKIQEKKGIAFGLSTL